MQSPRRLGLAAIIAACVLWGGSFFFGKIVLRELSAVQLVLWRFVLATLFLAPLLVLLVKRRRDGLRPGLHLFPQRKDALLFATNALLMVPLQFVIQFEGLARTTATSAALIVGSFPLIMALGAVLFSGERMRLLGWVAIACSTVGLVVMMGLPGEGRTLLGDGLVLLSLVIAVAMVLVTQRLLRRYHPLSVTVWSLGFGTAILFVYSLAMNGWPTIPQEAVTWGALLGLGVGCTTITFSLWNWGLQFIPASEAGIYINLEPLIGAILGVVLLHDQMTGGLVIGGALILVAALLISWPQRRRVPLPV